MTFQPFPLEPEIATYSKDKIPFTVPIGKGYTDGEAIGNMDPIDIVESTKEELRRAESLSRAYNAQFPNANNSVSRTTRDPIQATGSHIQPVNKHNRRPRSQSQALQYNTSFGRGSPDMNFILNNLPPRSASDSQTVRPHFANYKADWYENAIMDDDEQVCESNYNRKLVATGSNTYNNITSPRDQHSYVVFSSNGMYSHIPRDQRRPTTQSQPQTQMVAQSQQFIQRTHRAYSQSHSSRASSHRSVARSSCTSRNVNPSLMPSVTELISLLKAPVYAVESSELRLLIIIAEAIAIFMAFNWFAGLLDHGFSTIFLISAGIIFLSSLFSNST